LGLFSALLEVVVGEKNQPTTTSLSVPSTSDFSVHAAKKGRGVSLLRAGISYKRNI
jgi:hypothetical protein